VLFEHPRSILLRDIRHGRIESAIPQLLLAETADQVVTCILPGVVAKKWTLYGQKDWVRRVTDEWTLMNYTWQTRRIVTLTSFGARHSLGVHWDHASNAFLGWYVNLQEPLRRTPFGFDTMDQTLDVWIEPDRSWHWKDWDELLDVERAGVFTSAETEAIRAEGGG
jgi:predicted RNA-binding protein associated with RNAse of E/G family